MSVVRLQTDTGKNTIHDETLVYNKFGGMQGDVVLH